MLFGLNGKNKIERLTDQTSEPFILLRGVVKRYETLAGALTALDGIDLTIRRGNFIGITGKSGAGKTTLVNMISGLDHLSAGEIWIGGAGVHAMNQNEAAHWRGHNIGVVFQSFQLLPGLTVLQNVMLPMDFIHDLSLRRRKERALLLLDQVGIVDHAYKRPAAVSGGQQQRIAIARALANDPPIVIADEPTGSLDSSTKQAVFDVFAGLVQLGKTVLLVTHDRDLAAQTNRIITLLDGHITGDTKDKIDDRRQAILGRG